MLTKALLTHPRPVPVATPDRLAPREYGFSREPGYYADELDCREYLMGQTLL